MSNETNAPKEPAADRKIARFGAPLMGLAAAVLFYFAAPWLFAGEAGAISPWVASIFGFGAGTTIGLIWFGTFREGP